MRKRRTYTDDEKAAGLAALAAEGGSVRKAARVIGVSPATLRGWRDNPMPVAPELVEAAKGKLGDLLEGIALKLFTGLDKPEAIARLLGKPAQAAVVGGIVVDKIVNLRRSTTDESKMTLSEFLSLAKWDDGRNVGGSGRDRAQNLPPIGPTDGDLPPSKKAN